MTSLTDTQVITASGGLVELGYVERTTNQSVTATTFAGASEVFATDLTFVADGSPVLVEFYCPQVSIGGTYIVINLSNGSSTDMGQISYNGVSTAVNTQYRYTPSAGAQTLNVRAWVQSGTGQVSSGAGGSGQYPPTFLRVSKIVQATQWPAVTTGTIICTSSTRPSAPFEGQTIYETNTKKMLVWNGSAWRTFAETDASVGTPLQIVHTTNSAATTNGGAGSNYSIYAAMTTTITTGGSSRVLVDGSVGSMQPGTANSMAIVKCDYDNSSVDPTVTTNLVAGTSVEWSHSGYDLKNAPFSGLTPVLAAGTYTFRVKVRSLQAVTTTWNWHGYAEQRSWLTLTELAA